MANVLPLTVGTNAYPEEINSGDTIAGSYLDAEDSTYTNTGTQIAASTIGPAITELASYFELLRGPTGFPNRTDSTLSFTPGTRTFAIAPAVTSFKFYIWGAEYTVSSSDSVIITDTEGIHYIYYDKDTQNLTASTSLSEEDFIKEHAGVAAIYWNATDNEASVVDDERHFFMDPDTHYYIHETIGTAWDNGLALGSILADAAGNLDTHSQFSVSDGDFRDEDLEHAVTDDDPQDLSPTAQIPIWFFDGAAGNLRITTASNFPFVHPGSTSYYSGTTYPAWNEFTGGSWQLTELGANKFALVHYVATPSIDNPIIGICGQAEYNNKSDAQAGAETELGDLFTGGLLIDEILPLATVIYQTSPAYSNTYKTRIVSTAGGDDYIDWRVTRLGASGGTAVSDHGSLTGLADDDHTQYVLVNGTRNVTGPIIFEDDVTIGTGTPVEFFFDVSSGYQGISVAAPTRALEAYHATDDTLAKFESGDANCYIEFKDSGTTADNKVKIGAVTDDLVLHAGGSEGARLDSSGQFGISTTTPGAPLHVNVTADTCALFGETTAGQGNILLDTNFFEGFQFREGTTTRAQMWVTQADGDMYFQTDTHIRCRTISGTEAFRFDIANTRIGIGDAAPSVSLDVYHATDDTLARFESGDANSFIDFKDNATTADDRVRIGAVGNDLVMQTAGTERVRIEDAGQVGVGTSAPDTGSVMHIYDLTSNVPLLIESGNGLSSVGFKDNATTTTTAVLVGAIGDDLYLRSGDAERARIDSAGQFGIGTSTPGVQLEVYHATDDTLVRVESGDANCFLDFKDLNTTADDKVKIGAVTDDLVLHAGGSEGARLDSGGQFGIGTTSPDFQLDVYHATDDTLALFESGDVNGYIEFRGLGTPIDNVKIGANTLDMVFYAGASEHARLTSAGIFDIGITSSSGFLRVTNSSNTTLGRFDTGASSCFLDFVDTNTTGNNYVKCGSVGNDFAIYSNNAERIRIDSTGEVGIGTTSPSNLLHVYHATNDNLAKFESGDSGAYIEFADNATANTPKVGTIGDALTIFTGADKNLTLSSTGTLNLGPDATTAGGFLSVEHASNTTLARLTTAATSCNIDFVDTNTTGNNYVRVGSVGDEFRIYTNNSEQVRVDSSGNIGIGTTSPTEPLDVNSGNLRLRSPTVPATAGATGAAGEVAWDSGYLYVCTATNTWKRAAIATW